VRFFLKYLVPVLALLWLVRVHPLGAAVAVLLCIIRCAFKSHLLSLLFAHAVYDILKATALGAARLILRRRRA
jgi:hypothetical protein